MNLIQYVRNESNVYDKASVFRVDGIYMSIKRYNLTIDRGVQAH